MTHLKKMLLSSLTVLVPMAGCVADVEPPNGAGREATAAEHDAEADVRRTYGALAQHAAQQVTVELGPVAWHDLCRRFADRGDGARVAQPQPGRL